jgi:hypothetical protein
LAIINKRFDDSLSSIGQISFKLSALKELLNEVYLAT